MYSRRFMVLSNHSWSNRFMVAFFRVLGFRFRLVLLYLCLNCSNSAFILMNVGRATFLIDDVAHTNI